MNWLNGFLIKLFNKKVGIDEFGNEYFESKKGKRLVVYKGLAEPSKIPFEWHSWIHYYSDIVPININTHKFSWQKIHVPNLTGTKNSYSPKDSVSSKTTAKYESWTPK